MSADEPRRLFDDPDVSSLLRGALEAERADDVDAARLSRIGQALALAEGSAAPPSSPDAPSPAPAPATGGSWLASKGPYVLLAAAMIGGVFAVANVGPAPVPAAPPASVAATVARTVDAVQAPEVASASGVALDELPSAPAPAPAPKPARTAPAPTEADEIALLARAHDALSADPARALALCKEHEGKFAGGHFAQEREAVAIEALVYLGRTDEARRRWESFQRRYPSSSHRVHLQSLLAAPPAR